MSRAPQRHKPGAVGKKPPRNYHRWYSLAVWLRLRERQLSDSPLCVLCDAQDLTVPATDVDHRIAHRGNWALFVDPQNLQSLCASCHSAKTARGE